MRGATHEVALHSEWRGVLKDAIKGGLAASDDFGSAIVLGPVLLLLALERGLALLLFAFLFGLVLGHALFVLGFALRGFLLRLDFRRGCHRRDGMGCCFGCCLWVMHRAMLVRANGELATKLLAVHNDGIFSGFARHHWFHVRIVGHGVKFANMAALQRSGSLPLEVTPAVLDLNKAGMGCNLAVKECLNLAVVAG